MDQRLATLALDLSRAETLSDAELSRAARRAAWVAEMPVVQLVEFLQDIESLTFPLSTAADRLLALWLLAAVQARRKQVPSQNSTSAI